MIEPTPWHRVRELAKRSGVGVIDVRSSEAFTAAHLPMSLHLTIDPNQSIDSLLPVYLLPPRHDPLLVVTCDQITADRLTVWLRERGRSDVEAVVPDWASAPSHELETGPRSSRLWRPPSWLEEHVHFLPRPQDGPVVDLGCGSGRAAAWLLERGYSVTAVDRYAEALGWARDLAGDHGTSLTTLRADLTRADQWPPGPWSAALAFRFLHRPLLAALSGMLMPGGVVMIRTFRWQEGPWSLPRRHFCLEPGELDSMFRSSAWEILASREDQDPDDRPGSGIVARKT